MFFQKYICQVPTKHELVIHRVEDQAETEGKEHTYLSYNSLLGLLKSAINTDDNDGSRRSNNTQQDEQDGQDSQ